MMIDLDLILEDQGEAGCVGECFQFGRGPKQQANLHLEIFKHAWGFLGQVRVVQVMDINCGGSSEAFPRGLE